MSEHGLKLPTNIGVPDRQPVNQQGRNRWSTFDQVANDLIEQGFIDADKPEAIFPNLTLKELVDTPNKEYTGLHARYLEWWRYTAEVFARIRALGLQVKNEMEDIALEIKRDLRGATGQGKKPTEEEVNTAIGTNARYRDLKQLGQSTEQARILLETKVEYLERGLRVISRQIELKKIDASQGSTNDNMPGRGGRPPYPYNGAFAPPLRNPGG